MATLQITDLHVSVETEDGPKEILKGVDLTIRDGETHVGQALFAEELAHRGAGFDDAVEADELGDDDRAHDGPFGRGRRSCSSMAPGLRALMS